jgi:hypothetical protein
VVVLWKSSGRLRSHVEGFGSAGWNIFFDFFLGFYGRCATSAGSEVASARVIVVVKATKRVRDRQNI